MYRYSNDNSTCMWRVWNIFAWNLFIAVLELFIFSRTKKGSFISERGGAAKYMHKPGGNTAFTEYKRIDGVSTCSTGNTHACISGQFSRTARPALGFCRFGMHNFSCRKLCTMHKNQVLKTYTPYSMFGSTAASPTTDPSSVATMHLSTPACITRVIMGDIDLR